MTDSSRPLLPLELADAPPSLRRILSQDGIPCEDFGVGPNAGRFVLFDSQRAARPSLAAGRIAIDLAEVRREFEIDPFAQLDDASTARTWWNVGPWTAAETTARVDKSTLREQVLQSLQRRIETHGGVWMSTAPVPHPYRAAFNFRFDHDAYDADDFAAVRTAITGHEAATTHFICAAAHEPYAASLESLRGCDVGSHGYLHHTYATFAENRLNIARGIESLRRLGFEPNGFAAPHGRYQVALAAAMTSLGITHSSEFAAAYDDRPFQPAGSTVLQIPIHPVCLGIVLEAVDRAAANDETAQAAAADDVTEYFLTTAETKRALGEPIFLYGHPDGRLGRYPHVLRRLLSTVAGWSDVWSTTLSEFQRWWQARATATFRVYAHGDGYLIRDAVLPRGYACGIRWTTAAGEASVPLGPAPRTISRETVAFTPRSVRQLPKPVQVETPRGWKDRLRRVLDWEYVTPIDEIDVSRWQGLLKRSLRRWKARAA